MSYRSSGEERDVRGGSVGASRPPRFAPPPELEPNPDPAPERAGSAPIDREKAGHGAGCADGKRARLAMLPKREAEVELDAMVGGCMPDVSREDVE